MTPTALRIVHVSGATSHKYGGFERFMFAMADACAARGHRFTVFYEKRPTSEAFCEDLAAAGAGMLVLPARRRPLWFLARLTRWLYAHGIDVAHAHFGPGGALGVVAARLAGVPLVLATTHSGLPRWLQEQGLPLRTRLVAMARRSLSARVFTVCQAVANQYRRAGLSGRRMMPQYLGIPGGQPAQPRPGLRDEVRCTFGFAPADLVIGCVAFQDPVKGVDVLLRALPQIVERAPRARVLQIGCPPEAEGTRGLQRLAEALGVAGRIVWAGRRDDVVDLLPAVDVYCQPSRSEGLPLTVFEAMDSGLPVVATRVGGIPEAVQHGVTGLLVPPEAPERLAEAVGELLRDPARRQRMGRAGRQRVRRHFILEDRVRLLLDTYEAMWRTIRG